MITILDSLSFQIAVLMVVTIAVAVVMFKVIDSGKLDGELAE